MSETIETSSTEELMSRILNLSDSTVSLFHIRTRETVKASVALRREILELESGQLVEWDHYNGLRTTFDEKNYNNNLLQSTDPEEKMMPFVVALGTILDQLRMANNKYIASPDTIFFHVFVNPHPTLLVDPAVQELFLQLSSILATYGNIRVAIISQARHEELPLGHFALLNMRVPSKSELDAAARSVIDVSVKAADKSIATHFGALGDWEYDQLASLGMGMTQHEFTTHIAIGLNECFSRLETQDRNEDRKNVNLLEILKKQVSMGKTEVIGQSEILELYQEADLEDVGGMDILKGWLEKRRPIFEDPESARAFGITPPKGALLVGPPGTGKSLVSKATSGSLGVPLVRMDMGKVFSKYIGDSERRMQDALDLVGAMGAIVLFVDEIDKGLGGSGSALDGGTSRRVVGQFLTWMQEVNTSAFVLATANDISGLPPELTRKGRLDQIFSTNLPGPRDREEIIRVHIRIADRDVDDILDEDGMATLVRATKGFVPAEIEQVVKDGLILAFTDPDHDDLTLDHLLASAKDITPMSISHAESIAAMVKWSRDNALAVSSEDPELGDVAKQEVAQSQVRSSAPRRRPVTRTTTH